MKNCENRGTEEIWWLKLLYVQSILFKRLTVRAVHPCTIHSIFSCASFLCAFSLLLMLFQETYPWHTDGLWILLGSECMLWEGFLNLIVWSLSWLTIRCYHSENVSCGRIHKTHFRCSTLPVRTHTSGPHTMSKCTQIYLCLRKQYFPLLQEKWKPLLKAKLYIEQGEKSLSTQKLNS